MLDLGPTPNHLEDFLDRHEVDQAILTSKQERQRVVVIVPQDYSEDLEVNLDVSIEAVLWR